MEIARPEYLRQLIDYQWDGQVKVITGIRRCGKSYLLKTLFRDHLLAEGVRPEQIITVELDLIRDIRFRDPLVLAAHVRAAVAEQGRPCYLFVDEIQMSNRVPDPYDPQGRPITFYDALNDLRSLPELDIYVTGSNSRMLSTDILTEFRGRSDEIRVHPLSFAEFYSAVGGDRNEAFDTYALYGGMPLLLSRPTDAARRDYLTALFSEVYLRDIVERKRIEHRDVLEQVVDLLCSSVGSLTNPTRIADTLRSKRQSTVSTNTIRAYLNHLEDAFLFSESRRYDVKGKAYFDTPNKYYCEDVGLRNARLGFRQQEMTHLMENLLYNELRIRRFPVDVGVVYARAVNERGNSVRVPREIDFVVQASGKRTYIQSAYAIPSEEKRESETRPFALTGDSFPKIVVRRDVGKRWYDEQGVLNINVIDFLLDKDLI